MYNLNLNYKKSYQIRYDLHGTAFARNLVYTFQHDPDSLSKAIQNASKELDIPIEDLKVDIIEPGSAGIFGLVGGKKAKIKVTVKGAEPVIKPSIAQPIQPVVDDKALDVARDVLERILSLIPVEATVNGRHEDSNISLNIEGEKSGLLIGRKGKTLDALQYIVNKIVNKAVEKKVRVIVDSENYRERRKESLTQLAIKMGNKAKRIRKPVTTNPLNPRDRRIFHLALKEDQELDTKSRGEGILKKITIFPKR